MIYLIKREPLHLLNIYSTDALAYVKYIYYLINDDIFSKNSELSYEFNCNLDQIKDVRQHVHLKKIDFSSSK